MSDAKKPSDSPKRRSVRAKKKTEAVEPIVPQVVAATPAVSEPPVAERIEPPPAPAPAPAPDETGSDDHEPAEATLTTPAPASDDDAAPAEAAPPPAPAAAQPKKVVIGVTGEPGAGKSALAKQLAALGGTLIDVDALGHDLIETPTLKKQLVQEFSANILASDGGIDRRKLAAAAFADAGRTAALNRIVHPELSRAARQAVAQSPGFAIVDAALLHELGLNQICSTTVYVKAGRESRLARVSERGWDDAELARREAALGNADARRKACQLAVDNSGDPGLLAAYARTILARQLGVDPASLRPRPQPGDDGDSSDGRDERPAQAPAAPQENGGNPGNGGNGGGFNPGNRPGGNQGAHGNQQQGHPGQQRPPQPAERAPVKVVLDDYLKRLLPDLQAEAEKLDVRDVKWLKKHDLISEILRRVASGRMDEIVVSGFMEIHKDQHGYIRSPINNYLAVSTDAFVTAQQLRRYGLKPGMQVTGTARAPRGNEKGPQLLGIQTVMGEPENKRTPVQEFEHLVPLHAHDRLFMELPNDPTDYSLRIFDLCCPIGKGQRGLIVAQPKCGKTVYLQKIANAITTNNPEVELMVLLVDERPEEVTDMQRSVRGEVIASTFDQPASRHVQCAEITINKAKRLVERGRDVVILLDSVTRLARAYNTEAPGSGRVMSGGIESGALIKPKQFFGAARKIEGGGSLTILATALVDTGSLADTVIFEEFKGTGNMELVLDRRMADRRVFPAINCGASGTRKDDLLIKNKDELVRVWALKRFLAERNPQDAVEFLKSKLKNYKTNVEFLLSIDPEKVSSW